MKKQLLALSLLAAFAGMAHAPIQRHDLRLDGYRLYQGNRFGPENGLNGTAAVWDLRAPKISEADTRQPSSWKNGSMSMTGAKNGDLEFEGASNVGLAGPFGAVRLGRMNEIATESFRRLDPFNQEGVGSMLLGSQRTSRVSNATRYDSPTFNGFKFSAAYYLGKNTRDSGNNTLTSNNADNDGFALGLNFDNGPLLLLANYSRLSDSNDSNVWSLGASYKFGSVKIGLGYERTDDKGWKFGSASGKLKDTNIRSKQDNWILSADYKTGAHRIAGSFNWMKVKDVKGSTNAYWTRDDSGDVKKYSIGYFYSLSKRTTLYGQLAYSDFEDKAVAEFFRGKGFENDSVTGVQVGINHKF